MTIRHDAIEAFASEHGLSEQSKALLNDLWSRLSADELGSIAHIMTDGEASRNRKGWVEVFGGDNRGDAQTLSGTCDAIKLVAQMMGGPGRLVFALYKKVPKGGVPQ